ncbi:hypothetical protein [Aeromicrobium sp. PE09-221]|uniref:hypothetical protein n=1 Tax=Aeromicrobium sp. PE09-221 TaxID=1898043 RepID=UPI000B3EA603|nr:hypothetical protein [Aeromicrobium sp. PE09-221]
MTPKQLRSGQFAHPVDGVAMSVEDAGDLWKRCRAVALGLGPTDVFTHLTSARLRGWWLTRLEHELLIACSDGDAAHLERRGVYVRRCRIPAAHRVLFRGLPVASPEWTILELAEHLSFVDLVIAIDSALRLGHTTPERIIAAMVPGRRGVRNLRRALAFTDRRSESAMESLLRLSYVLAGVPVDVHSELRDDIGEIVWSLDLRIRGTRYAPEYDGGDHRTPEMHRRDLRRDRLLHRWGIERWGYTLDDIVHRLDEVLADAERVLGWTAGRANVALARDEIRRSVAHPAGRRALSRRLQRFVRDAPPRSRRAG